MRSNIMTVRALAAALIGALALARPGLAMAAQTRTITCPFLQEGRLAFDIPARPGALPHVIDFDTPVTATKFRFGGGVLTLRAIDESDPRRLRIDLSARRDAGTGAYVGTLFVDTGGNLMMLDTAKVRCTLEAR